MFKTANAGLVETKSAFYIDISKSTLRRFVIQLLKNTRTMRFIRVQSSPRKTVIYHPSLMDVAKRIRCIFGVHEYETVLEYPSVGAREDMCLHCMKERYTIDPSLAVAAKTSTVV
jgi:adenylyl- and sulfurtransferase ThiI